jgi:hypothetical protein
MTTTTLTSSQTTVRYHPIRGAIYGLLMGLGLALVLMVYKVLALSVPMILVLGVVFLVLGGLWGRFAPVRSPKGTQPTTTAPASAHDQPHPAAPPSPPDAQPSGD